MNDCRTSLAGEKLWLVWGMNLGEMKGKLQYQLSTGHIVQMHKGYHHHAKISKWVKVIFPPGQARKGGRWKLVNCYTNNFKCYLHH